MLRLREGSALTITTKFYDETTANAAPLTLRYKLTCSTTNKVIMDWTSLTVLPSVTIRITSDQNDILNSNNDIERKVLSIEVDNDLSTAYADEYEYEIKRLT